MHTQKKLYSNELSQQSSLGNENTKLGNDQVEYVTTVICQELHYGYSNVASNIKIAL